jgi:Fe2+ transport system protein B
MKKFIQIFLTMNVMLVAMAAVLYFIACFVAWSMIDLNAGDLMGVRFMEVILVLIAFFISLDKDY